VSIPPTATIGLVLLAVAGTVAVVAAERQAWVWRAVAKPIATASLFLVVGPPGGPFGWLVVAGLALSLAGDIALLSASARAFVIGLVLFLGAHLFYTAAFFRVTGGWAGFALGAPVLIASAALLSALWPGLGSMRVPVLAYTAVISVMVLAASGTRGGAIPETASLAARVGACLFYVADASLAWNRFRRPIPHSPVLTMGVYWLGQAGIALATRLAVS
jgi:uncharacterized membrane protein YhhN